METIEPVKPVETVELFPGLSARLLHMLKSFTARDWQAATICPGWSVKDVTAHLLGGNLGRLSFGRDRLEPPKTTRGPMGYGELLDFINRRNAEWVNVARQISDALLIEFIELTDPQVYEYFKSLPPLEKAAIPVSWAGETQSAWWFDIAREYTEKWLHQQHIREAVGAPLLAERQWLFPVLDTFVRALPYAYRHIAAANGTAVFLQITGEAGGEWTLRYQEREWRLYTGRHGSVVAAIQLDQDIAWRLLSKGIDPPATQARMNFSGDSALAKQFFEAVAIMA